MRGGRNLIGWLALSWLLVLIVLAVAFWPSPARADLFGPVEQAAWLAYHNKTVITPDGKLDCDDVATYAHRYLGARGIPSTFHVCLRQGEGHVYLTAQGRAIDNRSPYPISEGEVGCEIEDHQ